MADNSILNAAAEELSSLPVEYSGLSDRLLNLDDVAKELSSLDVSPVSQENNSLDELKNITLNLLY